MENRDSKYYCDSQMNKREAGMLMCTAANNSVKIVNAEGNFLKYYQEEVREVILGVPGKLREITRCSEEGMYVL